MEANYEMTEADVIHYMRQTCQGVQHIHKNNIIHLDLKVHIRGGKEGGREDGWQAEREDGRQAEMEGRRMGGKREDVIHYMRQTCQGVQHIHKNNSIYLDSGGTQGGRMGRREKGRQGGGGSEGGSEGLVQHGRHFQRAHKMNDTTVQNNNML